MSRTQGFTLLEVLITVIVLAVGLLGLASLQSKVHINELESYQRAQAVLLLQDMVDRISTNRANAASYVTGTGSPLGTGDGQGSTCPVGAGVARDQCEWSNALKGSAEKIGGSAVGAMLEARGCVEQVQAANAAPGVCAPGIYRVSVVWLGMTDTFAPSLACGQGSSSYPTDARRRLISANVTVGLPGC